jgi:hypothetical protein
MRAQSGFNEVAHLGPAAALPCATSQNPPDYHVEEGAGPIWCVRCRGQINRRKCEVAHTSSGDWQANWWRWPGPRLEHSHFGEPMLRTSLWNDRVSRVVLDYRSREAHLRLERIANDCLCRVPQ